MLLMLLPNALFAQFQLITKHVIRKNRKHRINYSVNIPVLTGGGDHRVIAAINQELNAHSEDDSTGPGAEHTVDASIGINDDQLFSIVLKSYDYGAGAVHGNCSWWGCTFDMKRGDELSPKDLFSPDWDRQIRRMSEPILARRARDLFPEWRSRLRAMETTDYGFYPAGQGLVVYFSKYTIAPGVFEVISITIPYAVLKAIVPKASKLSYKVQGG